MSYKVNYDSGARVWIRNENDIWEAATLEDGYHQGDSFLNVKKDNGDGVRLSVTSDGSDLPPLRNPDCLLGQDNLTSLSYLHEPGVLHNLKVRFVDKHIIYTYCDIVLVAINPYADLPLYGPDIMRAYRGCSMGELEPHIFALAEEAFNRLEYEKCNLSIIVSGESGAGKTVSAKYAMRYFAAVSGSESETQVEQKVLASLPIMEAFGNAKTPRNDNSSRFGKFTKLLFSKNYSEMRLTGACMDIYLLEKTRVVSQTLGERNYHIFHQLCAARDQYPKLNLEYQEDFDYLNQGCSPVIVNVDDREQFNETLHAMSVLGFSDEQIMSILKLLAGILHLGNVRFVNRDGLAEIAPDICDLSRNEHHLRLAADMLEVNAADLRQWLITRNLKSKNECVLIPNTVEIAQATRDALSKHIYAKLFEHVVSAINAKLDTTHDENRFIGVLDIYGFETFETNSFEQFCINYANEKLQQQFNHHVFKLEQLEYIKEGVDWTMIDFPDNQPCIDLIESKLGILNLLDDECKLPQGTDDSWTRKLFMICSNHPFFEKSRYDTGSFSLRHFSGTVEYTSRGFLEKNRDTVSEELVEVLRASKMPLCEKLMCLGEMDACTAENNSVKHQLSASQSRKRSVGSQFRESLASLMATLHATIPHYVRCIKPNDEKIAFKWVTPKVAQQLRACGVIETVRISAAGFPSRWLYAEFYRRYQLLSHRTLVNPNNLKQSCHNIISNWIPDEDKYRFGRTQIFFRAGQVAYLEKLRACVRSKYTQITQAMVRMFVHRRRFLRLQRVVLFVQAHVRRYLARKKTQELRRARAAVVITKWALGVLARRRFKVALENRRAVQLQRFVRGYLARRAYLKIRHDVILCQAVARGFLVRRQYKRLKKESEQVSKIEITYKGLENKIISMQQKIDQLSRENAALKAEAGEIAKLKMDLDLKKKLEDKVETLKQVSAQKDLTLNKLYNQVELERDEITQLVEERTEKKEEWYRQKRLWRMENASLKQQLEDIIEMAMNVQYTITPQADGNGITESYQRALREKEFIVKENSLLKEKLKSFQKPTEDPTFSDSEMGHTNLFLLNSSIDTDSDNFLSDEPSPSNLASLDEQENKNNGITKQSDQLKQMTESSAQNTSDSVLKDENDELPVGNASLQNGTERCDELQKLCAQHQALKNELERRQDESIKLKGILQQHSEMLKSISLSSADYQNLDMGELIAAFQAQKATNMQFEAELDELVEENNKCLASMTSQIENIQNEISKISNLLQTGWRSIDDDYTEALHRNERQFCCELEETTSQYGQLQEKLNVLTRKIDAQRPEFAVRFGCLGVLQFQIEDVDEIVRRLVAGMVEQSVTGLSAERTAHIVLMCIRYADAIDAEEAVRALFSKLVMEMRKIHCDPHPLEVRILWLVNSITLLNLLRQYGDLPEFIEYNTDKQKRQQLKKFNLFEQRQVLHEVVRNLYRALTSDIQNILQPHIGTALLANEEIQGLCTHCFTSKHFSVATVEQLTDYLAQIFKLLESFGLSSCYSEQIIAQLLYYISAVAMNRLMLSGGGVCNWKTGMMIRYNLRKIEDWLHEMELSVAILAPLEPLGQAAQLLQARKNEQDVNTICELCPSLTTIQVSKIMRSYKLDDFEDPITVTFLEKLEAKLDERETVPKCKEFAMNEKFVLPFKIVYKHSSQTLQDIEVPRHIIGELLQKI